VLNKSYSVAERGGLVNLYEPQPPAKKAIETKQIPATDIFYFIVLICVNKSP